MYYDYHEPLKAIPSHRMLAMRRGEKEEVLLLVAGGAGRKRSSPASRGGSSRGRASSDRFLEGVAEDAYKRLIAPSIEVELRLEAKKQADEAAIAVFADNLRNLLLAPPAGGSGCSASIPGCAPAPSWRWWMRPAAFWSMSPSIPTPAKARVPQAKTGTAAAGGGHDCEMIAIGNGTAGRETEQFVKETLAARPG